MPATGHVPQITCRFLELCFSSPGDSGDWPVGFFWNPEQGDMQTPKPEEAEEEEDRTPLLLSDSPPSPKEGKNRH